MKSLYRLLLLTSVAFLIVLSVMTSSASLGQDALTLPESRGKQIYVLGTSRSGRAIQAYVGESSLEIPGPSMACANCHGLDGRGKPEGGISPSDITSESLTKPYGVTHPDGRKHPAYTDRAFEIAITRGIDPAGNRLLNVMPRYSMSREDLADLIAYLRRLGRDHDPGITENRIVVGVVTPEKGALAEMGQAIKAVISAFFDDLNKQGGIFTRQIELKFVETGETAAVTRANVERLLRDGQVFAMTGSFIAGAEKEIVPLMAQTEVPLIGALTLNPQTGFPLNRQVFYLLSGQDGQARTLIHFVAEKPELKKSEIAIVYPESEANAAVIAAAREQSRKDGLRTPEVYGYTVGRFNSIEVAKRIKQTGRGVVLFLGTGDEALAFMREADKSGWFPAVFLTSPSGSAELFHAPAAFDGKIFLSFPTSPSDQTAEGISEFRALATRYKLPTKHIAVQLSAYSAAKILAEALKRAGRDVSREKLINVLEGFYEYRTGLTPAITYGPNTRIGAMGAYVIAVDLKQQQFVPASGWIKIE
jgi:ABC-type branched-subunit amino acid transport system substrate-binding protein